MTMCRNWLADTTVNTLDNIDIHYETNYTLKINRQVTKISIKMLSAYYVGELNIIVIEKHN